MSANSSLTSSNLLLYQCSAVSLYTNTIGRAFRVLLILPLSTFVLYLGHQRWRQQRSFKTASHSDIFTYHMAAIELIWILGCFLSICGSYTNQSVIVKVGSVAIFTTSYGEILFHVLTCAERYLAVVHPITYLGFRNVRGARIRNISTGCAWLLCCGLGIVTALLNNNTILLFCFLVSCTMFISFCSLSVLCVLIRPGPGEGGDKERVDQSKLRAFYTITAITCSVWLWLLSLFAYAAVTKSPQLSSTVKCLVESNVVWFNLPSSLALPLLYLHRARKLSCCLNNNE